MIRSKGEFIQGTLDMLILKTLGDRSLHGYAIAARIQQRSRDVLRVEEGSLYPALYRLEEDGWIESTWGTSENNRRAKFYRMTRRGRAQLRAEADAWDRLAAAVTRVMRAEGG